MVKIGQIKRIVALGSVNLSDHWAELFYLDEISKKGLEVIYLNVDKITLQQNPEIINNSNRLKQIVVNSIKEFKETVQSLKNGSIFLPCMSITPEVWDIFRVLINQRTLTDYMLVGVLPVTWNDHGILLFKRIIGRILSLSFIEKFSFYFKRKVIFNSLKSSFAGGTVAADFLRRNGCKKIININTRDFEEIRNINNKDKFFPVKNHCLFVDNYLPFHPDNYIANIFISPDNYYRSINKFFDHIEKEFNYKVVIAAHPKSQYDVIGNRFNNRTIIKGQTGRLIKHSKFILNHESSALSFAIEFKKRMLFLTTEEIIRKTGWYGRRISGLGKLLGCQVVNIDNFDDIKKVDFDNIYLDNSKYDDYKYGYLTSKESENKRSCDIIMSNIYNNNNIKNTSP
jgi:hypothetical protein